MMSFGWGSRVFSLVGGLLFRNLWAEISSAIGGLGGSRLAGWGFPGGWAGGLDLSGLAGIPLGDFRLAGSGVGTTICLAGSGLSAVPFAGVGTRQPGAQRAVGDGGDTGRAAQDGEKGAVAGGAVGDGRHVRLPAGEGSGADWAANRAAGNRSRARLFAGTGYVESPRAGWLAGGRSRRPQAAAGRLAGGR